MIRRNIAVHSIGVLCALTFFIQRSEAAATCESLTSLSLPNTTITAAQSVAAGAFTPPGGARGAAQIAMYKALPPFCRVTASVKPTSDSDIKIEVWMPTAGWNGNFRGTGNVGLGGVIEQANLGAAMAGGYATAGNDTGHEGDSSYALTHPEKIVDFGHRAFHEMTVKAKAIMTAFYGKGPKFSFMDECGGGTIPAMNEAARYPEDYDGLAVVGFGAYKTHHVFPQMWIWQATHKDQASYIPPEKYPVLHNAVLAQCDALDGVKDGLLENPTKCNFDPKVVQCKDADGATCLTAAQVEAARKIYEGATDPRTKKQLWPSILPGTELRWAQLAGPRPLAFATDWFKFFVYRDPNWDWNTRPVNFDKDVALSDTPINLNVNGVNPDLRKFVARGGKLLMYEGYADPTIPPGFAIDYYKSAVAKVGAKNSKDSLRLYMVPGMDHCPGDGNGVNRLDMLNVLNQWLETKKAPNEIVAPRVEEGKTVFTRPLCPYPQVAAYKGTGSTSDAANFVCKAE